MEYFRLLNHLMIESFIGVMNLLLVSREVIEVFKPVSGYKC